MALTAANFGISQQVWNAAKAQAKSKMTERASKKLTIAYGELVSFISAVDFDANDIRLFHLLGEVSVEENAAGRGMLSVVVVHKHGDMMPGPGFFELAEQLGRHVSDREDFWVKELNKVNATWKPKTK